MLLGTGAANAAETIGSWTSGSTTLELTDDGVLTVSGTGAMEDYATPPWYDSRAAIKTLVINEGVTSIGDYAFSGCSGLTSVTIPDGVTSIGVFAFDGCSGLTSVSIGSGVTSIGMGAFAGCSGLTSVVCLATTPPTFGNTFTGGNNFSADSPDTLYVPASALDAYKSDRDWKWVFNIILPIESATSVKAIDGDKLHVYPNPTAGVVYVDNADGAEIKVYNLSGALLHRTRESRVDLSGEPSGVYLLRVGGEAFKVVKK
ncbi:hypothetical protein AGMMS49965_26130 [Bacteroidia bacterium]|nr:hypothetical protein AGMMS49965_26130 [Bacteroidia bacterium]